MRPSTPYLLLLTVSLLSAPAPVTPGEADELDGVTKTIMGLLAAPEPLAPDKATWARPDTRRKIVRNYGIAALPAFNELARGQKKDANLRVNAILGIAELIESLEREPTVRVKACREAFPVAMAKLQDDAFCVRYVAMRLAGTVYEAQAGGRPAGQKDRTILGNLLGVIFSRRPRLEKAGAARALMSIIGVPKSDVTHEDEKEAQKAIEEVREWYKQNKDQWGVVAIRPPAELLDELKSGDPLRRKRAVGEIADLGDPSYGPKLCEMLQKEKDADVLNAIAQALKQLTGMPIQVAPGDSTAKRKDTVKKWLTWYRAQPDIKTLNEGTPERRLKAVGRLKKVDDSRIQGIFVGRLLAETDKKVTEALAAALTEITGHLLKIDFDADDRQERVKWWEVWVRTAPLVQKATDEKDATRQPKLIRALNSTKYRHAKLCDALLDLLVKTKSDDVRSAICGTIEGLFFRQIFIMEGMSADTVKRVVEEFKKQYWAGERSQYE